MVIIKRILSFIWFIFFGLSIMVSPVIIGISFHERKPILGIFCIFFVIWMISKTPAYKKYAAQFNLLNHIDDLSEENVKKYLEILAKSEDKKKIVDSLLSRKDLCDKEFVQKFILEVYPNEASLIEKHFKTLRIKEKQKTVYDDYGIKDDSSFISELRYFSKKVLLSGKNCSYDEIEKNAQIAFIEYKYLKSKIPEENFCTSVDFTGVKTGEDYENYIFDILSNNGFIVKKTPKTGDQGVDLLVKEEKGDIAIQCKLYSKPVGNKAVQEVVAGKEFYACSYSVVVSNNNYTVSARRLAENLNVYLCHHETILDTIKHIAD